MVWGEANVKWMHGLLDQQPDVRHLLGFNEPNHNGQANLSPAAAVVRQRARQGHASRQRDVRREANPKITRCHRLPP